eukprot:9304201-Pyramimonas_sp.AAC.1
MSILGGLDKVAADEWPERGAVRDAEHDAASASAERIWSGEALLARGRAAVSETVDFVLGLPGDLATDANPSKLGLYW